MDREFIMQMRPWIGDEERQAVNELFDDGGVLFAQVMIYLLQF